MNPSTMPGAGALLAVLFASGCASSGGVRSPSVEAVAERGLNRGSVTDLQESENSPSPDEEDGIHVKAWARYEHPFVHGNIFITSGGRAGTASRIRLRDDLGLDDTDAPRAGVDVSIGDHRIRLSYEPQSFDGAKRLSEDVVFHGATFPMGTRVRSAMDLNFYTAGYDYRLVREPCFELRLGAEAFVWDFSTRVSDADTGDATSRGFVHILPAGTLAGRVDLGGGWHADAQVSGGLLASDRSIVDLEASVGVRLWDHVDLEAGYRYWNLVFHETTNEGDIAAHGPFFSVSVEF